MNANGKKMRQSTGLNRYELHRSKHAKKSPAKIRRMRWTRIANDKAAAHYQAAA